MQGYLMCVVVDGLSSKVPDAVGDLVILERHLPTLDHDAVRDGFILGLERPVTLVHQPLHQAETSAQSCGLTYIITQNLKEISNIVRQRLYQAETHTHRHVVKHT